MMEKLGVEKAELLTELRTKYNDLRAATMVKTAAEDVQRLEAEMDTVKARITELEAE